MRGGGRALHHHLRKRRERGDGSDGGGSAKRGPQGAHAHGKETREAGGVSAIIGLSLAFIMALGMGVSGTFAYISSTQTSTGNLLAAGTLNLTTNDADGVSQTLYALSMSPGDTAGPAVITLKNTGTVDGATLDIVFSYAKSDGSPNAVVKTADEVAAMLEVITLDYGGASLLGSISDTNSNGYKDVKELTLTNFTGMSGIAALASKEFVIAVRLRGETPNDFQSDGIVVTMTFTLKQ